MNITLRRAAVVRRSVPGGTYLNDREAQRLADTTCGCIMLVLSAVVTALLIVLLLIALRHLIGG